MLNYADMHCDTLLATEQEGEERLYYTESGMQSISLMHDAGQLLQFFAVFFPPHENPAESPERLQAEDEAYFERLRARLLRQVSLHGDVISMAYSAEDVTRNRAAGRASAFLTVEDGRFVQGKMEKLAWLKEQGVTAIGLTWNGENCFGYPNSRDPEVMQKGLTGFGREAIAEMERLGILVDVSHLSDGGFFDVAALSGKPFIASHSNCRAVRPHPRNLTDEMIRLLAEAGGVAGLNLAPGFVAPDGESETAEYLADHVLHMMNVGGEDVIAIGADFDGTGGKMQISRPPQMQLLFDELRRRGMTQRQLDKLASENVLRVLESL